MMYYLLKVLISAILIVIVSEISKRHALIGAIFASIPLVSVLAMIWLYAGSKNVTLVANLSKGIFWLVIPSLALFVSLPIFLKWKWPFYPSLLISTAIMIGCYFVMIAILKHSGMQV